MTFVYGVGRGQRLSMEAEQERGKGGKRDASQHINGMCQILHAPIKLILHERQKYSQPVMEF